MITKKGFILPGVILLLVVLGALFTGFYFLQDRFPSGDYETFSSCQDLKTFIKSNRQDNYFGAELLRSYTPTVGMAESMDASQSATKQVTDYSETNIQVEGVDEADIVKTDGDYIYVVSGHKLYIMDSYPAEDAEIISEVEFDGTPQELFVNGDKLVVFGQSYDYYRPMVGGAVAEEVVISREIMPPSPPTHLMFLEVYDLEDRENPEMVRNVSADGYYFDSRMIGDYVYIIVDQYIYDYDNPIIPKIYSNGEEKSACNCPEVHYFNIPDSSYKFTTVMALDIQNDDKEISSDVYLMGGTQNIYVSEDNIYVTYTNRLPMESYRERMIVEVIKPLVSMEARLDIDRIMNSNQTTYEKWSDVQGVIEKYFNGLSSEEKDELEERAEQRMEDFEKEISKQMEKTTIHKISINEEEIEYEGRGEVPGVVLNQFSMDENDDYFRIATTTGNWRSEDYNHLYVLDENLEIVGKLEDLAKGERIKSARFIGDRCYLVTFVQIDPLFVIDLENPENPKVLGELKVSGYSDYLHPYDENHLIGIGKETEENKWGGVTETGVKLALFDVSNVENPEQVSKFIIDGNWAYTDVTYDHKAFLFDKEKELLVIPVSVNKVVMDTYMTTQGAYVFNLNLDDGFDLKGIVEHEKKSGEDQRYYYRGNYVKRSLYIEDVLYTISDSLVKMNGLDDLEEINSVELK